MDSDEYSYKEHAKWMVRIAPLLSAALSLMFVVTLFFNTPLSEQVLFGIVVGALTIPALYFQWKAPKLFLNIILLSIILLGSSQLTKESHWLSYPQIALLIFSITFFGIMLFKTQFRGIYDQ